MLVFLKKYYGGFIMLFIFLGLMFNLLYDRYKEDMLKNSKEVFGVLIKESHSSNNFIYGDFYYYAGKKKHILSYTGDFSYLKKGDTVLVRYALEDPSIAKVSDRYFMKKYRYLKKK